MRQINKVPLESMRAVEGTLRSCAPWRSATRIFLIPARKRLLSRQAGSWAGTAVRLYSVSSCVGARRYAPRGRHLAEPRIATPLYTHLYTVQDDETFSKARPRDAARDQHMDQQRFLPKIPSIGALKVPKTSRRRRSCLLAPPKLPALIWCFTVPFYGPYSSLVARHTATALPYKVAGCSVATLAARASSAVSREWWQSTMQWLVSRPRGLQVTRRPPKWAISASSSAVSACAARR